GVRQNRKDVYQADRQKDRRLHHREIWMTRTRFHQGLDDLKQKLLTMGGLAEQAVELACRAFQTRDVAFCELVLRDEAMINAAEREVDELSVDLLAMQ